MLFTDTQWMAKYLSLSPFTTNLKYRGSINVHVFACAELYAYHSSYTDYFPAHVAYRFELIVKIVPLWPH